MSSTQATPYNGQISANRVFYKHLLLCLFTQWNPVNLGPSLIFYCYSLVSLYLTNGLRFCMSRGLGSFWILFTNTKYINVLLLLLNWWPSSIGSNLVVYSSTFTLTMLLKIEVYDEVKYFWFCVCVHFFCLLNLTQQEISKVKGSVRHRVKLGCSVWGTSVETLVRRGWTSGTSCSPAGATPVVVSWETTFPVGGLQTIYQFSWLSITYIEPYLVLLWENYICFSWGKPLWSQISLFPKKKPGRGLWQAFVLIIRSKSDLSLFVGAHHFWGGNIIRTIKTPVCVENKKWKWHWAVCDKQKNQNRETWKVPGYLDFLLCSSNFWW